MKIKPTEKRGGVILELGPKEAQLPSRPYGAGPSVLPEFKLKKILVPVDFSECMKEALLYAVPFAKQFDAELTLLHVMEPAMETVCMAASEIAVITEVETAEGAESELKRLQAQLAETIRCQTVVRRGAVEPEIIAVAKEQGSDLIILSTHGRTGLERLLLGSTAERVVRHAGCPLLIVRSNEREFVTREGNEWQPAEKEREAQVEAEMTAGL